MSNPTPQEQLAQAVAEPFYLPPEDFDEQLNVSAKLRQLATENLTSEPTVKARRSLLATCAVSLLILLAKKPPEQIAAAGWKLDTTSILGGLNLTYLALGFMLLYFLRTWWIYQKRDRQALQIKNLDKAKELQQELSAVDLGLHESTRRLEEWVKEYPEKPGPEGLVHFKLMVDTFLPPSLLLTRPFMPMNVNNITTDADAKRVWPSLHATINAQISKWGTLRLEIVTKQET